MTHSYKFRNTRQARHRWDAPSRQLIAESQFMELLAVQKRIRQRTLKTRLFILALAFALSVSAAALGILLTEHSAISYFTTL